MKQVLQNLKTGETTLVEVPVPNASRGCLLIASSVTLVSAGTERMLVEFGKAGWIDKARQQPDKVRMVLDKARVDGLVATVEAVQSKLDQPIPLGYCNVGVVKEIGSGIEGFAVGDRVVSNGSHAEAVCVARNLCAKVPDGVSDEAASFTVLAAIGLQSIRLTNPTMGECVVVTGLGLVGLLTVQMLRAQGCRVLGVDFDPTRLELARRFGAEVVDASKGDDVLSAASAFSRGRGVDAVIIAAATKSDEPIRQAAQMCRKRGRIVLVGVVGLSLARADFYEKELTFQVSCSYGPGRYDPAYEEGGNDYPIGFVRWTEQRNFEAVLDLMASGFLNVEPLISHRFQLKDAVEAYEVLSSDAGSLGILLQYPQAGGPHRPARNVDLLPESHQPVKDQINRCTVVFLGAGNYAGRVLVPAFKAAGADLRTIVSSGGVNAVHQGRKHGFARASTDGVAALEDSSVNTVVVATRHDVHARQVLHGLRSGKHVFCEKPLCLTLEDLEEIESEAQARPSQILMLGFNRRFAPQVVKIRQLLADVKEPKSFVVTVNAGAIPASHWTQDKVVGGGRIVGEGCHFIDLLRFLAGERIVDFQAFSLGAHLALQVREDKATITLRFADGSVGSVHYLANGHRAFPKERIEIFCAGRVLQLDNFRRLRGWGWKGFSSLNLWRQNKGQNACARAFVEAVVSGGPSPIALQEILEVSRVSIEAQAALGIL